MGNIMDNISPVKRVRVGELYSWIFQHAMFDYWREMGPNGMYIAL
jgi:hypothetical protein